MNLKGKSYLKLLVLMLLSSLLFTGIANAAAVNVAGTEKNDVLIAFDRQPGSSEEALVRAHGGSLKYTYHLVPAIAASIPQAAMEGLQRNPHVVRIEPDVKAYAIGDSSEYPWGITQIGADIVHNAGEKGMGVKVAIIDSGIDYNHPDLSGNYVGGYDFVNKDDYPMDDNGHGTHVAGTVAAIADSKGVVGVAPEVGIYALKVLGADGSGSFSNIIKAVEWCVDKGIQVTNNSYGSSRDPGVTVSQAFNNAYNQGVLHVAAAGNSGKSNGTGDNVGYPAKYDSVIAVAATDSNNNRASFSSTGSAVELAAPGVSIYSTIPGNKYATYSGTSMASPHVAGTAALVIASGVIGPDNVRKQLQDTADDLGTAGRDNWYGFGLVDADEAAGAAVPPPPVNNAPVVTITNPAEGASFASGSLITFTGTAADQEDGDVTNSLTWTSSKDGQIGTGGSFTKALSDGTHTITATAADSKGITGSSSITITVASSSSGPTTVSVITPAGTAGYSTEGGKNNTAHLLLKVTLKDDLQGAVAGASVTIKLYKDESLYLTATGTTGTDGTVTFKATNAKPGTYRTEVYKVVSALTWDGKTPTNSFTK